MKTLQVLIATFVILAPSVSISSDFVVTSIGRTRIYSHGAEQNFAEAVTSEPRYFKSAKKMFALAESKGMIVRSTAMYGRWCGNHGQEDYMIYRGTTVYRGTLVEESFIVSVERSSHEVVCVENLFAYGEG